MAPGPTARHVLRRLGCGYLLPSRRSLARSPWWPPGWPGPARSARSARPTARRPRPRRPASAPGTGTPAATRSSTPAGTRCGSPGSTGTASRRRTRSRTACGRRTTTRSSTTSRTWATTPSGSRSPTRWWRRRSSRRTSASTTPARSTRTSKGSTRCRILDKIVAYAGQAGLKVILDDHRSEAGESAEQNGLWYTSAYRSSAWVNDWVTLAKMVREQPHRGRLRPAQRAAHPDRRRVRAGRHVGDRRRHHRRAARLRAGGQRDPRGEPERADLLRGHQRDSRTPPAASTAPGGAATCGRRRSTRSCSAPRATWSTRRTTTARTCSSRPGSTPPPRRPAWTRSGPSTGATSTPAARAPLWVGEFGTDNTAADVSSSHGGLAGPVVLQPGVLHQEQPGDGLDLLGAERRGFLRAAGRQLRRRLR